jgi:hypothetical protein
MENNVTALEIILLVPQTVKVTIWSNDSTSNEMEFDQEKQNEMFTQKN